MIVRFLHLTESWFVRLSEQKMHDSHRHVFTDEFDEICVAISLNMSRAAASMRITISERNSVWNELVSADSPHHKDASSLSTFEGGL